MKKVAQNIKGFTLVELLVVIGILAILTTIVLVAVNPGRQFAQARDTQRRADVNTISSAIVAYMADPINKGNLPAGLTTLCTAGSQAIGSGTGNLDLAAVLAPDYVADLPLDPSGGTATDTGYTVCVANQAARRITVAAPSTELVSPDISLTR